MIDKWHKVHQKKIELFPFNCFPKCGLPSLYIFKIDRDIKHLNSFECEKMLDHILEIPRLVVFGVECFNMF